MSHDSARSWQPAARAIGGVLLAVILVTGPLQVVPLPDLDLPFMALGDVPGWVVTVVKVKVWVKLGVVVAITACVAADRLGRRRPGNSDAREELAP